jgi:hypothetical protein
VSWEGLAKYPRLAQRSRYPRRQNASSPEVATNQLRQNGSLPSRVTDFSSAPTESRSCADCRSAKAVTAAPRDRSDGARDFTANRNLFVTL